MNPTVNIFQSYIYEVEYETHQTTISKLIISPVKLSEGNIIDIDATIICERDSHKGIIIGKQGSMLKKIGSNARYELERMLEAKVNLKLWVKVKKDWRDSDFMIKNFGYDKKGI